MTAQDELANDGGERRWDAWAWLTLAAGMLLILLPIALNLVSLQYPTDGWESNPVSDFGVTGPYQMQEDPTGGSTDLQPEDQVVAINGRSLSDDSLPPMPPGLRVGQTLRYTIMRGDQQLDVDVALILHGATLFTSLGSNLLENPGNALFAIALVVLAFVVFLLRPGNLAARFLFLLAMFSQGINLGNSDDLFRSARPATLVFLRDVYGWGWVYVFLPAIVLLVLVFPIRKWPIRRFPSLTPFLLMGLPFIIAIVANAAVWFAGYLPAANLLLPMTFYSFGLMLLVVPVTLIHNLLTIRDPLPRAQMRWIAFGFGLGIIVPMTLLLLNFTVWETNQQALRVYNAGLVFLPLGLAIGILRQRLFDIDVIIRKTTQYAIITGILLLIYFGSIVVLQRLLAPITGESNAAVVLSTLLIAALFLPLRRRVQAAIDRRFFRNKYDAEKVLESFAATVRDETDLDALTAELVRVIQETMQPEFVSVWLKPQQITSGTEE